MPIDQSFANIALASNSALRPTLRGYIANAVASAAFARTDSGVALSLRRGDSDVYWPDERNSDAALRNLRAQILSRDVYAFGGSIVGCYGSGRSYPPSARFTVSSVDRRYGAAYLVGTGTTAHGILGTTFLAIDPIDVGVTTAARPEGWAGSSDVETPCGFGFRFADPWQAGVTITSDAPPPDLSSRPGITPGTTKLRVLWLLGYPDSFGTATYFNDLKRWDYSMPAPFASSVTFANNSVVTYDPPGRLP